MRRERSHACDTFPRQLELWTLMERAILTSLDNDNDERVAM